MKPETDSDLKNKNDETPCWRFSCLTQYALTAGGCLLALVGLEIFLPRLFCADCNKFAVFIAVSYAILVAALAAIWLYRIPNEHIDKVDYEALWSVKLKATVAILVMTTVLGIGSFVTLAITRP